MGGSEVKFFVRCILAQFYELGRSVQGLGIRVRVWRDSTHTGHGGSSQLAALSSQQPSCPAWNVIEPLKTDTLLNLCRSGRLLTPSVSSASLRILFVIQPLWVTVDTLLDALLWEGRCRWSTPTSVCRDTPTGPGRSHNAPLWTQ